MKCKQCKSKFIPKYFNQKYCMVNDECIKAHVESAKKVQIKVKKKENQVKKLELKPKSFWLAILQKEINQIVRLIDNGCPCISSGRAYRTDDQAGHYFSLGSTPSLRFNLLNIWSQSIKDNLHNSGNLLNYREQLVKFDIIDLIEAERLKYPTLKLSIEEIKEAISKAKIVKKELNLGFYDVFLPRSIKERVEIRLIIQKNIGIYKA